MKRLLQGAAAAAALLTATSVQAATVIDFDEYKHAGPVVIHSNPIVTKGFSFTSDVAAGGLGVWGTINNADPDGATLVNWNSKSVTVRRTDGGAFSLASIDLTDTYNSAATSNFLFTFFDGKATTTELVALDQIRGLQTYAFNRGRLEWFSYTLQGSQGLQIDNVVLSDAASAAVPEPSTWALLILGFGGAGAAMRRQRRFACA